MNIKEPNNHVSVFAVVDKITCYSDVREQVFYFCKNIFSTQRADAGWVGVIEATVL